MSNVEKAVLDWSKLGFSYIKTDKRYIAHWKDGNWSEGKLIEDNVLHISEGSTALHYGQQCFEGLKSFTMADGRVAIFRPNENAKRMRRSAETLLMPQVPEEMFVNACIEVVKANMKWVPPYGHGASFYLRPLLIGVGDNLGVRPAREYTFLVLGSPVGPYFKAGLQPVNFIVTDYDRAAPNGTGHIKVGGNYAASLLAHELAAKAGFQDAIYLDPATHTYIEEVGAANFFGITRDNRFVTPKSNSILPSITRFSLLHIAGNCLGMQVEERPVRIDSIDEFSEAGCCGTAAVISPIGAISYKGKLHVFGDGKQVGPVSRKLYDTLAGMQTGLVQAPEGWLVEVK
ncbi:MAG: branched-chain amino acid aminotransferase [Clostridia bacterium]|nr:branched-chain amino acid aminotransferase [Clostridia bacterium]